MALAAVTVQGGLIVSGIPPKTPDRDRTFYYTTPALVDAGFTLINNNAGILIDEQYGTLAYMIAAGHAAAAPGSDIYLSTVEGTPWNDQNAVRAVLGTGNPLPLPGALSNVVTSTGSSGQVRFVSADMPVSELPIARICCRFIDPLARWSAADPLPGGGNVHQSSRDPIGVTPNVTSGPHTGSSTANGYEYTGLSTTVLGVRVTQLEVYQSGTRRKWLHTNTRFSTAVENSLRLRWSNSDGDSGVMSIHSRTNNAYRMSVESGDDLSTESVANITLTFEDLGASGDGEEGDLWIRDQNKAWRLNSAGTWRVVTGMDLSGGTNLIHVVSDQPLASFGSVGDIAVRPTGSQIQVWNKKAAAERIIMQPTFPFMIDGLVDGQAVDFHLAAVNLRGMGPEITVSETPTDTPLAPPAPVTQVANGGDGVTAWVEEPADELTSVEFQYRDNNRDGYQMLQEGTLSTVAELPATVGREARVRAVQVRNPSSAGPEVVVNEVGKTDTGIRIPPGYRTRPYPGPGKLYSVLMKLESHPDGRKFRTFGHPVFTPEDVPPEFTELGSWVTGMDVPVGGVVTNVLRQPAGQGVTADVPRQFIAIQKHIATGPTEPGVGVETINGEVVETWREYWRSFGEWVRFFVSGIIPDEIDDVDPDEELVPPSEDDPPETAYVLQMNNVVTAADGAGGLLGVGEAGEYAFVYRGATGALRLTGWEVVKKRTTTLVLALIDRLGQDRTRYHMGVQPGDFVVAWWSNTRWIRFDVLSAKLSEDGRKCVIEVLPTKFVESGGTGNVTDGNMEFRFSRNPPILTTPEASPVPTVPTSLRVTHFVQDSQYYTGTSLAGDALKLEIGAPAGGDTPFTYEARIGYKGRSGTFDIVAGGPETQGQRYWDGNLNPSNPTWPNSGRPSVNSRKAGVDSNGDLFLPRSPFFPGSGAASTRQLSRVIEYVEVRAGNPDGEYGPRLRVNVGSIIDGT